MGFQPDDGMMYVGSVLVGGAIAFVVCFILDRTIVIAFGRMEHIDRFMVRLVDRIITWFPKNEIGPREGESENMTTSYTVVLDSPKIHPLRVGWMSEQKLFYAHAMCDCDPIDTEEIRYTTADLIDLIQYVKTTYKIKMTGEVILLLQRDSVEGRSGTI